MQRLRDILQYISLSTPGQRLTVWGILTLAIYLSPFHWLSDLSLYKRAGLDFMPSIGLTRAYWLVLHGKIDEAAQMNWLIFVVMTVGGVMLARDIFKLWQKHSLKKT